MSHTPTLTGLVVGDAPASWEAAGFAVSDRHVHLAGVVIRLDGDDGSRGILGWQLDGSAAHAVEGLAPADVDRPPPHEPGHPNGVTAVDHVVVATSDVDRTTRTLAELGLEPRRTIPGAREEALTYRFFLLGTCVLELIGPRVVDPSRTPRDARFAGLAFVAPDLAVAHDLGVTGEPKPAVQPGRSISTVRTDELGISVPLALLTPRPG